jgi:hypothetical protein
VVDDPAQIAAGVRRKKLDCCGHGDAPLRH